MGAGESRLTRSSSLFSLCLASGSAAMLVNVGNVMITSSRPQIISSIKTMTKVDICTTIPARYSEYNVDEINTVFAQHEVKSIIGGNQNPESADESKAHRIGLSQGISLRDVLSIVWEARKMGLSVPVVLMGYSSVLKIGSDKLCVEAKKAGVVGFIIVGVSSEDAKTLSNASKKHDLAFIPLIFPTTPEGQMREIGALAHGFVYCVSHNGVTGIRPELPANLSSFMAKVRRHISLPLALGFGMATRRHFLQAGVVADGVVMGSKIIKTVDESPNDTASRAANVEKFCQSVVYGK